MKRFFLIVCLLASVFVVFAQTQQGYVKTKGRLGSNGQVIAGTRLVGATVRLKDKNVVSQASGAFSFVVSNKKYTVLDIHKKDYYLYDREQLKEYAYSSNPLILVLEKPDERESDKLMAQQKINRTLRRQLQQREDELEQLKEENKITQQEYQRLYNELYTDEKKNQELIESMAERYASMDFDQMDEENIKIKTLILNGELQKADSIINTKGSLEDRIATYRAHKEANLQEEQELVERKERLKKSKAVENLTLKEIAEDCMNKHEMYKMRCVFDSAAYYIQMRSELDTLNYEWQFDNANFCKTQNEFDKAETYYLKCQVLLEKINDEIIKNNCLAELYNNLGNLYNTIQRYSDSELMFKSSLKIIESIGHSKSCTDSIDIAIIRNNLAALYFNINKYSECEHMYKYALKILQNLARTNSIVYDRYIAVSQNGLGSVYVQTQRYSESEAMYKSALETYERLAKATPSIYEKELADVQNNLGVLYNETEHYVESETMYKSALEIRERLAKSNYSAYAPDCAGTLHGLGNLYIDTQCYSESEQMYKAALGIYVCLAKSNVNVYEPEIAEICKQLADLFFKTKRYSESETMYKSALEIRERLAKDNPSVYVPDVAIIKMKLADFYNKTQRYSESEQMYKAALYNYIVLAKRDSLKYYPNVALIQNVLGIFYSNSQRYRESEEMYKSALEIYERLAQTNPSQYTSMVADNQHILAFMYSDTKRYLESEKMYELTIQTYLKLYEDNPMDYEKPLMDCYYWLGKIRLLIGKSYEAQESFKQSLNLARQMHKQGIETPNYWEILYFLSDIMNNEKDYVSAYTYIEELLPFLKSLYVDNSEKYQYLISGKLISQSYYANLLGKFSEGEHYSLEALKVDSTKHLAYTNLAAAYLFQGKVEEAEKLYRQYKSEFKDGFLADFSEFERLGVIPKERKKDVERIKAMLKNE